MVRPHPGPGCRLRTLHLTITLQHGEPVTIHSKPAATILETPNSYYFRVVIQTLCHNDRPRRLSRRRGRRETRPVFAAHRPGLDLFLLLERDGGVSAGAGARVRKSEPGESGGRLWLRLGDTHTLTMDDEMWGREGGRGPLPLRQKPGPLSTRRQKPPIATIIPVWSLTPGVDENISSCNENLF